MKMKKLKRERSACHFLSPLESANTNGKSLSLSSYYSSCTPMLKYPTADLPISWCVSGYNSTKNKKYNFLLPQMGDRPHRQLLSQYFHQTKQFSTNEITLLIYTMTGIIAPLDNVCALCTVIILIIFANTRQERNTISATDILRILNQSEQGTINSSS